LVERDGRVLLVRQPPSMSSSSWGRGSAFASVMVDSGHELLADALDPTVEGAGDLLTRTIAPWNSG
jgi:hypothetical protein